MPEPEQALAGITEDVRRGDQPQPNEDFGYFFPTLQCHILKLGETEYDYADGERVQNHVTAGGVGKPMATFPGKPWRQHDQQAKHHAEPIYPRSMRVEKPKVRHRKPPLNRGIRLRQAEHDTPTVRRPNRPHRGRMSTSKLGSA